MENEKNTEWGISKQQMSELMKKLGTENAIEIFTPIVIQKDPNPRWTDVQISYSIHSLIICPFHGILPARETNRGYEIHEHDQYDYNTSREGTCFGVYPMIPKIDLRSEHFVFGIPKDSLIEMLTSELEKDRLGWMARSKERGCCVLEKKLEGRNE